MENKVICKKVTSMLSLYIDNNLSANEMFFVKDHIAICPACRKKYLYLKSLIKNLQDSYKQFVELSKQKQKKNNFSIKEHEKFVSQISPYIDNELNANECFEFRKYLMKSKNAQKALKNAYIIQKNMKYSFNKTKKLASSEITRTVIKELGNKQSIFDSVILKQIFTTKTAKIAILAGLVLVGAYEFKLLDEPIKPKIKQTIQQIIDKEPQQETDIDDFENYDNSMDINQ